MLVVLFEPATAPGLVLELEESADPPASLQKPEETALEAVDTAAATPTPNSGAATSPASQAAAEPQPEPSRYHGLFRAWEPMDPVLPLTNASLDMVVLDQRDTQSWTALTERSNSIGNMYLEGGRSYGSLKDFNVKYQFGKQLKSNPVTNEYMALSAGLFGLDMSFARKAQTSWSSGSSNSTLTHNWAMNYAFDNGLRLGYASDETRTTSSSDPMGTGNSKQSWTLGWQGDKYWVQFLNMSTANRSHATGAVSKTTQTQLRIGVPISELLEAELKLDINGNRNATPGSSSTEDDKFSKSLGLRYRASDKLNLAFNHDRSENSSESTAAASDFNVISTEYRMDYEVSSRLKFNSRSMITNNESSGRTTDHLNSLSIDHKSVPLFPGATSVSLTRKFSNPGAENRTTRTLNISTPLNYFKNRLNINLSRNDNRTLSLNAGAASETNTAAQQAGARVRITDSLSLNANTNRTRNVNSTDGSVLGYSVNNTDTDNVTYAIKFPLTRRVGVLRQCNYSFGNTVNRAETMLPTATLNTTQSLTHSGAFQFQGASWNGQYIYAAGRAIQNHGLSQNTTRHQFMWTFNELFGYRVTANFSTNKQTTGSASNGVFRATREINDQSTLELNYEFSKNKDTAAAANNTYNRFFQLVMKHSF